MNTLQLLRLRRLAAVCCVATLAACSDTITVPADQSVRVQLAANSPVPRAGGSIRVLLQNDTRSGIGYNLCTNTVVQRLDGTRWTDMPSERRACNTSIALLPAGQRIEVAFDLPMQLPSGRYRLAVTLFPDGEGQAGIVYLSNEFDVAP
jgi:hypothetical protein